ncbi:MAG: hypothetical protein ACUBOA_05210 [Candidatus Loosdrechtia sp.]|uniref:hypothetical protein n=1 Tax=Candidatus Loosdrechtia sp. TaxID=3101272 RepID=UPI003A5DF3BA|nr:MAG: hypothetical protein QY305_14005 [Candidatus Jettenia sp. AMX2]
MKLVLFLQKIPKNIGFYVVLVTTSLIFLFIEYLTHNEFMLHLAAIPLEILVGFFIVEKFLERREKKEKRRQLMFIKSCLFRSEMMNLFLVNFSALKFPDIKMSNIKNVTLKELKQLRNDTITLEYKSLEMMESVIMEYVKIEHVWCNFKERAITYDFEEIFHDMVYILHFIYDVKLFKENNPDKLFIYEAEKRKQSMEKVNRVLGGGIRKFLDYAIELKEKQPDMFYTLISDYELSSQIRRPRKQE